MDRESVDEIRRLRRDLDSALDEIRALRRQVGKVPSRIRPGGGGGGFSIQRVLVLPAIPTDGEVHFIALQSVASAGATEPTPSVVDQVWWWMPGQTAWRPLCLITDLPGTPGTRNIV